MSIRIISFTDRGDALAGRLAEDLGGEAMRCGKLLPLEDWTARSFAEAEALIFVGAAGIAVRAVAPHVWSKTSDPAVVVIDESGRFAIPLLSGHLGGANDLARQIADLTGATAVITTATDLRGAFAVDEWARRQGCAVRNPEQIKRVSSAILAGKTVRVRSDFFIAGEPPAGVQIAEDEDYEVCITTKTTDQDTLILVPKISVLGVGCKAGTPQTAIERSFRDVCAKAGICEESVCLVSTIDQKAEEPGLLACCKAHGLSLITYSAEELQAIPGDFSSSEFVRSVTGTDNVCERSAVKGSGGSLILPKTAKEGVTMALATTPFALDWRWQDEK